MSNLCVRLSFLIRSNRTFMELKLNVRIKVSATEVTGSNRTFMELKWKPFTVFISAMACSNRTFMELK